MPKRLIVNADDFGLTSSISRGIVEAHRNGMVTSASIMASGEAFEEACELAKQNPELDLGVHLTLDEEKPVLEGKKVPTLLGPDNRFHTRTKLIQLLFTSGINLAEVEQEWAAQIERCLEHRLVISHLDSHGHIHSFPSLAFIAGKLCGFYNISFLRKPREPMSILGQGAGWRGYVKKGLVSGCAMYSLRASRLSKANRVSNFLGLAPSGHLNATTFWTLARHFGEGINEVMTHPGYADAHTRQKYGHWRYNWEQELTGLLAVSKERDRLREHGVTLTSFGKENPIGG